MLVLGYYGANLFVNVVKIPTAVLGPIIIVLSIVGSYAIQNSLFDSGLMLGFGLLGYLMRKLNIDSAPAVLALILGPMAESNVRRALLMGAGNPAVLFKGLINWVLIIMIVGSMGFAFYTFYRERRTASTDK